MRENIVENGLNIDFLFNYLANLCYSFCVPFFANLNYLRHQENIFGKTFLSQVYGAESRRPCKLWQ